MQLVTVVILAVAALASAQLNTTQLYKLRTQVLDADKPEFNNLYLTAYHTGAGLSDATFLPDCTSAAAGFLNQTNVTTIDTPVYNQVFDLGNDFPWSLVMAQNTNFYAHWQPVRINAAAPRGSGPDVSGFFLNDTGLQWSSTVQTPNYQDVFGGWLVCSWWHSVPQLFFRLSFYNNVAPTIATCANVLLIPEFF